MMQQTIRKIAANYIYLPDFPLTKNGYVILSGEGDKQVIDTGGKIQEIAGLEFYGGLIVPAYVAGKEALFISGQPLLPVLGRLYALQRSDYRHLAIIEGADLRALTWKNGTVIRFL